MLRLVSIVLLAPVISAIPFFQLPTFSIDEINAPLSSDSSQAFIQALTTHGMLAVSGVPALADTRAVAFNGFESCIQQHRLGEAELTRIVLKDGTRRSTLETLDDQSLPSSVYSLCGTRTATAMARLRQDVGTVNQRFAERFKEAFASEMEPVGHSLSPAVVMQGQRLEHFHQYSRNATSQDSDTWALKLHEDMGLYLAFVPALSNVGSQTLQEDDSFVVEIGGTMHRARFGSADSVVFMMGAGAARWFAGKHTQPTATPHALRLMGTGSRIWFGAMQLPPAEAAVLLKDNGKALSYTQAVAEVQRGGSVAAGCGSGRRAEAQSGDCKDPNQTMCWMQCVATIPCPTGNEMVCIDQSVQGNQFQQAAVCNAQGVVGGAMHDGCKLQCVVPDKEPAKDLGYCQGGTDMYMGGFTWPSSDENGQQCIILLFESWKLDSSVKFWFGCVGTVAMGILLEALIFSRRLAASMLVAKTPVRGALGIIRTQGILGLLYGAQLTVGYFLMLIVMTYSAPLFMAVLFGLVLGHIIFALVTATQQKNARALHELEEVLPQRSSFTRIPDGATPCCLNDLNQ
eukprot:TRINITY_DN5552_c0_g1_i1.p1 TRINITY_DN5552_c0_g1~~TRINITY_DN5552_c0_g1_i1.p1  ORF type:complete len:571 (-),score=104.23 TRINITY_DN5552_c0_g1_i1:481-2193(-)